MNSLQLAKKVQVVATLVEGNSIRSTERLTGTHRDTVMRLGRDVGEGCERLHDRLFRDLQVNILEVDELWSFVGKKQGRLQPTDPKEFGDSYTFLGTDATRKAIISYTVGARDSTTTQAFCQDLRGRVLNRPQISSDGFQPYIAAIEEAFGAEADYAQVVKEYSGSTVLVPASTRYSPARVKSITRTRISGQPDPTHISTSYVERTNLSVRMGCRRFTRLTNGFSKKLRHHRASVALWVAYYNLCRVHETLRTTPAMALGVTDHVWTIEELVREALATEQPCSQPPNKPEPQSPTPAPQPNQRPRFTVIQGGRSVR